MNFIVIFQKNGEKPSENLPNLLEEFTSRIALGAFPLETNRALGVLFMRDDAVFAFPFGLFGILSLDDDIVFVDLASRQAG
jgi:hypothetical protein